MKKLYIIVALFSLMACENNNGVTYSFKTCSLDALPNAQEIDANNYAAKSESSLVMQGWVADIDSKSVAVDNVDIILVGLKNGAYKIGSAAVSGERPDVETAFSEPLARKSGFNVDVNLKSVASGKYQVQLSGVSKTGHWACATNKYLVVD